MSTRHYGLRGHFVLDRAVQHPRFTKVVTYSPRNHVHEFRLTTPRDIDAEFRGWVARAYLVGRQEHLPADRCDNALARTLSRQ